MRRIMSSVALLLVLFGGAAVATQDAHDHNHNKGHHHHPHRPPHECIHDRIKDLPGRGVNAARINVSYDFDTASTDPAVRRVFKSKASTYASIRVSFFWDSGDCTTSGSTSCGHCTAAGNSVTDFSGNTVTCGTDDVLTDAKKNYIMNQLMPAAANFYAQALSVVPVSGNLILKGTATCGSTPGTPIPAAHQSTGIANTDISVYVTAAPMKGGGSTAAWAVACAQDTAGRAIAAHVNFVPSFVTNAVTQNTVALDSDIHLAIHEIGHALGFSAPWFDSNKGYLNLDGVTYTVSTGLTTVTSSTLGKSVTYLSSPRVAREVQNYFGCSSIPGAEIEDQGGSGTAGSHFEKRVFPQDTMSGISSPTEDFHSRFFLAMLEDTGHYVANYNVADPRLNWGKGKGCAFVINKCNTLSTTTVSSSQEFCFDKDAGASGTYCTYDRLARGYCGVTTYSAAIPSNFQYFSGSDTLGGSTSVADYCPSISPYRNQVCIDPSLQPTAGSSSDLYGETYSVNSRCFDSTLIKSGYSSSATGNEVRCFAVSCVNGVLVLTISGTTVKCPTDGTAGSADLSGLSGFKGTVTCPAASFYGCTSSSAGALGTTTAAPTVTASGGTTSPNSVVTTAPVTTSANTPTTTPSTSGTTAPSTTYQVTGTITLSGSSWGTLVNDATQYATVLGAVTADLASQLGVSASLVTVFKASVGSLVISFGVQSGSGKSSDALMASVNSAQSSTSWLSNTASVYSKVSTETIAVTSATAASTSAPATTTVNLGKSSAGALSTAITVLAAALVTYTMM